MNAPPNTESLLVAQRVYKWMLYAKRNLRLEELLKAVSIGVDGTSDPYIKVTEAYIMKVCANFVICNDTGSGTKIAQFAHSSVKDFLESRDDNEYSKGAANGQIAESCLSYLGQVDRKTIEHAYLDDGFPNYALAYWPLHLSEACANTYEMPIMQLSHQFSEERFEKWINMLHPVAMNLRHDISTQEKLLDCISKEPNRLFLACAWDIHTLVENLIDKDINLEELNKNNENALYIASKHGYSRIVKLLLKKGKVHVNACCGQCLGSLQVASKNGHISVVEILLSYGAEVKFQNGLALTLAAKEGHEKIVRLLMTNLRGQDEYAIYRSYILAMGLMINRSKRADLHVLENFKDALSGLSPPRDEALGSSIRSSSGGGSELHPDHLYTSDYFRADSIEEGLYKAVQAAAISGNHETVDILLENATNIGMSITLSLKINCAAY
jgi:ankyrin repeat protein